MKQIEDLAKAALGFDASRGDQISVQNIRFPDPRRRKSSTRPPLTERVRVVTERWTGLLRYAALFVLFLMVYLLILNPVKKQVLAAFDPSQAGAARAALPAGAAGNRPQCRGGRAGLPGGHRAALGREHRLGKSRSCSAR